MDSNKLVWFPDSRHGYSIGQMVDISRDRVSVRQVAIPSQTSASYQLVEPQQTKATEELEFPYKSVYPCDPLDFKALKECVANSASHASKPKHCFKLVDDNCALIHLNEAALLENIRLRFHEDKIYTYVAHILIAVNPYFEIRHLHSPEAIKSYQGKSLGTMPPHVYAIADKAYRDMKAFKQSQSIIINGESGAGKTESQKYVLRYLCLSGSQSGRLEKLILDANPLLEAFGNAKTIRNNNSSRFGKFIEIHYSQNLTVNGGLFYHYLLEKSRICTQSRDERNYHIFYQLCACLPQKQWLQLELGPPDKFHYLTGHSNDSCTQYFCQSSSADAALGPERKSRFHLNNGAIQDQLIDDLKCYEQTDRALNNFGVSEELKFKIYSIVASVLHLGNISFTDDEEPSEAGSRASSTAGCKLSGSGAERSLETTARLMGLDKDLLQQSLITRVMSTSRAGHKGTVYMVQLSVQQAQAARDALAKAIYSKLFDFIVSKIVNKSIPNNSSPEVAANTPDSRRPLYIGVLDVAGFEYFQHNSFEQFLINFCNEKLQQFFNERILKEEQNIYDKEGLNLKRVEFIDNQDCIQLFEMKSQGIFDLLDEESRLPKPSGQHFTQSVHQMNKGHFRLAVPRMSKLKSHREIRDDEGFLIRHFAGAVCYETQTFIEKNNDALHASLKNLMLEANNGLLRDLFQEPAQTVAGSSGGPQSPLQNIFIQGNVPAAGATSNKLNFISVGTKFRLQLNDLMSKLRSTGSHFIRCIKPNSDMVAHKFEGASILSQLHCSGMDSVLELMQQGYPSRSSFNDLYANYKHYLANHDLARLDSHLFCRALFKVIGLSEQDFRFGSSKVFFRPGKFGEFDQIIRSDSEHIAELVKKVSKWLIGARWRKAQYCCLSVIKLNRKILYRKQLIVCLQKNWRMANVLRRTKFRLNAIKQAKLISESLFDFESIACDQKGKSLQDSRKAILDEQGAILKREIELFIENLRHQIQGEIAFNCSGQEHQSNNSSSIKGEQIEETKLNCQRDLDRLMTKRDLLIRSIKDKLAEEKKLLELEQRVQAENRRREEEELAKRREEEIKQQRLEIELRRQQEEADKSFECPKAGSQVGKSSREFVDSGTDPMSLMIDQEQRDYEIALRLAQEVGGSKKNSNSSLETVIHRQQPLAPSQNGAGRLQTSSKFDLTKWKYSDLRDTINTSCDLELLEACKREFHRRLKVYHAWRAMNNSRQMQAGELSRAPSSVMENGYASNSSGGSQSSLKGDQTLSGNQQQQRQQNEQRYFRIPFVKQHQQASSNGSSANHQRGWWFAHFDGQWIARQLEIHPDREPILLVAGRDDIEMCELSLKETRLTSKRGAEILPQEFEEEWQKHGGKPYSRNNTNLISNNNNNYSLQRISSK